MKSKKITKKGFLTGFIPLNNPQRGLAARGGYLTGFTLIELLVVIAIIGILASLVLVSFRYVKAKARDTRRIADIQNIQKALEMYFNDNSKYPLVNDDDCGGWDIGTPIATATTGDPDQRFIQELEAKGYVQKVPVDPIGFNDSIATSYCQHGRGYSYHYYPAGRSATDYCKEFPQGFYVLRARLETAAAAENSPGFTCSNPNSTWNMRGYYTVGVKQ